MLQAVLLFALGLVLLIKGGDWFVDGATGLANRFHIPKILIGATVVSIGTTLPEVMVSATSAVSGHGEIAYGNAIGSVICNVALIAAITMAVRPSIVDRKSMKTPVIFFYIAAFIYLINAYVFQHFSRITGAVLLAVFVIYMVVISKQALGARADHLESANGPENDGEITDASQEPLADSSLIKELTLLIVGAALIAIGADLLVDNGTIIAAGLGVPESVIALTFVALGTSLPELITAITSLLKGQSDLSVGNIIGANLFNLVLVSGVSPLLAPFDIPRNSTLMGINTSLLVELPLMLFVMSFLAIPALIRGKLSRTQGIILLIIYFGFCAFQFMI